MKNDVVCGLVAGEVKVPLEGVRVDARLAGTCVEVTVTQRYRNTEPVPVEAVYVFPLEERAAVAPSTRWCPAR
jgi:Ca-activated chloride channel family protein